jgi:hypothetical protein
MSMGPRRWSMALNTQCGIEDVAARSKERSTDEHDNEYNDGGAG